MAGDAGRGHRGHPADPGRRTRRRRRHPAALADDRPAVTQGLDRTEGRRRPADRGHVPRPTRCRCWSMPDHPEHVALLESWMRSYRPEELFDEAGRLIAGAGRAGARRATGGWAPTRTPTAACCCATCGCPTSARHAVDVPSPGAVDAQDTLVLGEFLRDVVTLNQDQRNFRIFGPDETLSNLLGAVFEVTSRQWDARDRSQRRVPRARRAGAGLDAQRAPVRGLARGLPADRPARPVQLLRGLHPHRRLDVQPARQVAEGHRAAAVAAEDRLAELPARLPCLAAGPQRLHPPGPGLPRPCRQQEGRHRPRLPAARRQLPAVGLRPLPAQPPLRERGGRRQARAAPVADHGRRGRALHRGDRHLALGQQRPGRRAGRRDGLLRRHAHPRGPGRRVDPARRTCPS